MKTCTGCGETKPLDEYHRNKNGRDGRRERCKTCLLAQKREYNARPEVRAHRAKYDAEHKPRYYTEHRDAIRARQAEYYRANPHQNWVDGYRHRAKQYGHPVVIEPFTKDELIARWGDACWHCGGPFEQLDHFPVAVINGGSHTIENCRPSCTPCNAKGRGIRRTNTTTEKSN